MVVDFETPILTLKGKPLREDDSIVTVGALVMQLISTLPTSGSIPASARKARFALTLRIVNASEPMEVTDAEKSMILELLNASQVAPLYGEQIDLALDGKPNPLMRASSVVGFQPKAV